MANNFNVQDTATSSLSAATAAETTTTLQSAAVATGNGTILTLAPGDVVRVTTVGASTPSATVVYEFSDDAGATYYDAYCLDLLAATPTFIKQVAVMTTMAQAQFTAPPKADRFRARISMYTQGTVTSVAYKRAGALTLS